jgi:hypothetical protein
VIIFSVISLLREDPLSPGMLDMFFLKISDHTYLCKTEVIYLKLPKFSTDSTRMRRDLGGCCSISEIDNWDGQTVLFAQGLF